MSAQAVAAASPLSAKTDAAPLTGVLPQDDAVALMPPTVFFAGRTTSIQARNTGAVRFASGGMVLASLANVSGYASGVQDKYQAYLLTTTKLEFAGQTLPPGAYGCGFVQGQFLALDLGGTIALTAPAQRDTVMRRPRPLEFVSGSTPKTFRLYEGRTYVTFSASAK